MSKKLKKLIVIFISGILLIIFSPIILMHWGKILHIQSDYLDITGAAFIFYSAVQFYLNYDKTGNSKLDQDDKKTQKTILEINKDEKFIEEIKEIIKSEATETYLDEIKNKVAIRNLIERCENQSLETINRIKNTIHDQNKKANLNLIIGCFIALVGVIFLYKSNLEHLEHLEHYDIANILIAFIPKLSIVILIETFAYFFLKMYKHNLNEVKYFQNEATSIEHRLQALNIAIHLDDKETTKEILLHLSSLKNKQKEKNFVNEDMPLSLDYLVKIAEIIKK